jgi:hypothetical protein
MADPWWLHPALLRYLRQTGVSSVGVSLLQVTDDDEAVHILVPLAPDIIFCGLGNDPAAVARLTTAAQLEPKVIQSSAATWLDQGCCSPLGHQTYAVPGRWVRAAQAAGITFSSVRDLGVAITQRCPLPASWQAVRCPEGMHRGPFDPALIQHLPPWAPLAIDAQQWAPTLCAAAGKGPSVGTVLARLGWMLSHHRRSDGSPDPVASLVGTLRLIEAATGKSMGPLAEIGPAQVRIPRGWLERCLNALDVPLSPHGPVSPAIWEDVFWHQMDIRILSDGDWIVCPGRDSAAACAR